MLPTTNCPTCNVPVTTKNLKRHDASPKHLAAVGAAAQVERERATAEEAERQRAAEQQAQQEADDAAAVERLGRAMVGTGATDRLPSAVRILVNRLEATTADALRHFVDGLPVSELRPVMAHYGLATDGKRDALARRLHDHLAPRAAEVNGGTATPARPKPAKASKAKRASRKAKAKAKAKAAPVAGRKARTDFSRLEHAGQVGADPRIPVGSTWTKAYKGTTYTATITADGVTCDAYPGGRTFKNLRQLTVEIRGKAGVYSLAFWGVVGRVVAAATQGQRPVREAGCTTCDTGGADVEHAAGA